MSELEPSAWLASIAEIFDAVGVEWTLVGALAANRYRATPRFTTDVDTMAAFDPDLERRLINAGYDVDVIADVGEPPHLIRCHRGTEAVDILLPVVEYQRVALARARDHVLMVEDVIIHKLIAWRPRDRDDIRSILEAGADLDRAYLDRAYLDRWIDEWDVAERWATFPHEHIQPSDDHDDGGHRDHHQHHGHHNDQGVKGALRYLRLFPTMWRSPINDAVIDLVEPRANERVVDIGAGMGAAAIRAAARGSRVVAVEPTPFLRRVLRARRFGSRHRHLIDVVDGAAERIPAADRSIDAVWAVNTMHHWVDLDQGIVEIARVLRPTGRLLLVDEVFTDPSHPDHHRFGAASIGGSDGNNSAGGGDGEHHGFTMIDADEMGRLLRAAGLVNVEAATARIAGRPVIRVAARGVASLDETSSLNDH
jgi:SAM-dependent methyltransferase